MEEDKKELEPKDSEQYIAKYDRFATIDQNESIKGTLKSLCKGNNSTLSYKGYMDIGSGLNKTRTGKIELLSDVLAGRVKMLVVDNLDRLTRRMDDALDILDILEDKNVPILCAGKDEPLTAKEIKEGMCRQFFVTNTEDLKTLYSMMLPARKEGVFKREKSAEEIELEEEISERIRNGEAPEDLEEEYSEDEEDMEF